MTSPAQAQLNKWAFDFVDNKGHFAERHASIPGLTTHIRLVEQHLNGKGEVFYEKVVKDEIFTERIDIPTFSADYRHHRVDPLRDAKIEARHYGGLNTTHTFEESRTDLVLVVVCLTCVTEIDIPIDFKTALQGMLDA